MNKFQKINANTPIDTRILLFWDKSKHIEDGMIRFIPNKGWTHTLFDGEMLNAHPTHWMPIPEVENTDICDEVKNAMDRLTKMLDTAASCMDDSNAALFNREINETLEEGRDLVSKLDKYVIVPKS